MTAPARQPRGPRVIGYRRPWLYDKQEAFFFAPQRYGFCEASTKTGKTYGALVWLTEQACLGGAPGRHFWWIAPIHPQAEIAYERFKLYAPRPFYRPNDSKKENKLPNGALLQFKSGERPDGLYGEDVWAAAGDEMSRWRETAWHALRSTLTATSGRFRGIGNVKGRRNFFYHLCRRAQAGEPGFTYAKLLIHDAVAAGLVLAEEVEDARRTLPDAVFRELYLAEPQDDLGNPFGPALDACFQVGLAPGPIVCWGIDLGKSIDWTVLVGLNAGGRTAAFQRFQLPWAETLQRIRATVGHTPGMIDSSGVGDPVVEFLQRTLTATDPAFLNPDAAQDAVRRIQRAERQAQDASAQEAAVLAQCPNLVGFKFTSQSKQSLLEMYALTIQQSAIGLLEDPRGAVRGEHEAFEYEYTRTGVRYRAPEGMHDDTVMAYALAAHARRSAYVGRSLGGAVVDM